MRRAAIPEPRGHISVPANTVTCLEGQTMGTSWRVQLAGLTTQSAALHSQIESVFDDIVAQMSHWEPDSEISRYNRAVAGTVVPIGRDFATVMRCALELAAATDGAFDPALGEAAEAWGFGPSLRVSELRESWRPGGWREVQLTDGALIQPGGVQLDLSGIAKGYAVDKAAGVLAAQGLTAFLVEVGGEMYGQGLAPGGGPWWAGIELPRATTVDIDEEIIVALPGWALATSGDYRRFFERDGRRFSHTLDPAGGAPVQSSVASVSVLAADCMHADAFATALTVMGEAAGRAFADAHDLAALFLLAEQGNVRTCASVAWERMWA